MDYEKLKEVIAKQIKENGRGEITGPVLQAVLMAMVDSLGEAYPQTYTDEQKAQARANIDALSNYDGEITEEKLSTEVQAILNDVANKQNKQDNTLATTSKEVVGAINELFNGGVKNNSITTEKLKDQAVEYAKLSASIRSTLDMVGTNVKEINADTDLNDLKEEGIYVLMSNNIYSNLPVSDGVSMSSRRLVYPSILVVSDYVVANNQVQTYIGLSSIYSYPLIKWRQYQENNNKWLDWGGNDVYGIKKDVTTLQSLINTKVKIINKDTDLNTITEDGLYLLSAGHIYTNYPSSDGASISEVFLNEAALLIVSRRFTEDQISQVVISVSNSINLPLVRNRNYDRRKWFDWTRDIMYEVYRDAIVNSVKKQELLELTDTEVNNIWDNN